MFSIRCNSHIKSGRNYEDLKRKIKPFINKYNWEGRNFSSEKADWKIFEKSNRTIALNIFCAKKRKKYILPTFQNMTQIVKNKLFF